MDAQDRRRELSRATQISAGSSHLSEQRVGACRWETQEEQMLMAMAHCKGTFAWTQGQNGSEILMSEA